MNINKDHNSELMEQCQTLREYAIYVDRVRTYAKVMDLSTAVKRAIDECIQEGILEEFLRANRAEVIAMSIFEYDEEFEMEKLRKAEFEAGYKAGKIKRRVEVIQYLMENLKLTLEQAMTALGIPEDEWETYRAMDILEYDEEFEMKKLRQAEFDAGYDSRNQAGFAVGEMRKAKAIALSLKKMGYLTWQIARVVDVDLNTVQKWLTQDVGE